MLLSFKLILERGVGSISQGAKMFDLDPPPDPPNTKVIEKPCGCTIIQFEDGFEVTERECEKHFYENIGGEENE